MQTLREEGRSWLVRYAQRRPWRRLGSVTALGFVTMLIAIPKYTAQTLRKGVHVELPVTSSAVAMPDADKADALIVAVTANGTVYIGIDRTTPAALAQQVKTILFNHTEQKLFIKVDARIPYANVMKVLDAVRSAGVAAPNLLTDQHESPQPGVILPPKGLEVWLAPPAPSAPGAESILVQLKSGQQNPLLNIGNHDVPWEALRPRLVQLFENRSQRVVVLKSDGLLPFAQVVHVIDVCRSTGAKVVLVTSAT